MTLTILSGKRLGLLTILCALSSYAPADTLETEVEYLLQRIDNSFCDFVRNGKRYDSTAASEHLRMKYERGGAYFNSTEQFIDRIASKSSFSGKSYSLECEGAPARQTGTWLHSILEQYRGSRQSVGE